MKLKNIDMLKIKQSQNNRILYKCTSCTWDGDIVETFFDEIIGLHRCPNCSNYELKKIFL
jgi:predicted nucleic acid-binding Zn ribbon protein